MRPRETTSSTATVRERCRPLWRSTPLPDGRGARACRYQRPLSIVALVLPSCSRSEPSSSGSRVEIIAAPPSEDLMTTVQREVTRAKADGRDLLVYVGAAWCEPCQYFHNAAAAG